MSYDIGLYGKQFLKRALRDKLGDWTEADTICLDTLRLVQDRLIAKGYVTQDEREFEHANSRWGIQVSIFPGEVSFSVPYWNDADSAIEAARGDAQELAELTGLGFYDPQTGETFT